MAEHHAISGSVVEQAEEILRRRAEALSRSTADDATHERTALMLFRVGGFWYAVPIEGVREIIQNLTVTPIPCVPESIHGVVSVRGEIVSVTDAATFLSVAGNGRNGRAPIGIVLENDECVTAFVVDEVGGIIDVPATGVEPPLPAKNPDEADLITATVFLGDRLVSLLNVDHILQPINTVES